MKSKADNNRSRAIASAHDSAQMKEDREANQFSDNRSPTTLIASNSSRTTQLQTLIRHAAVDFQYTNKKNKKTKDKVGSAMEAWLDPHNPIIGSGTGTPQIDLYHAVKKRTKASIVRGHLLNHDLGGYGVPENLYPITSAANSRHKYYVENRVQKALNKSLDTNNYSKGNGRGIYYSVKVNNIQKNVEDVVNNKVQFLCMASTLKKVSKGSKGVIDQLLFKVGIESDMQGKEPEDRGKAFNINNKMEPDKESRKIVPPGWSHKRRTGAQDFNDKLKQKLIVVTSDKNSSAFVKSNLKNRFNALAEEVKDAQSECHIATFKAQKCISDKNNYWKLSLISNDVDLYRNNQLKASKLGEKLQKMKNNDLNGMIDMLEAILDIYQLLIVLAGRITKVLTSAKYLYV